MHYFPLTIKCTALDISAQLLQQHGLHSLQELLERLRKEKGYREWEKKKRIESIFAPRSDSND